MKSKIVHLAAVLALVFSLAAALIPAGPASAAIFNIADGDVAGLIAAINASNLSGEPDTINLAVNGTYTLNISDNNTDGPNGLPSINSSITINGNGATIQRDSAGGTPNFRIFHVAATGNVSMFNMTIRNGNVTATDEDGGGLYNHGGTVMMTNCTIRDNKAYYGGGLYNDYDGVVTMTDCTISGNTADGSDGGGLYNSDGSVTMTDCTVSDNIVPEGSGGGLFNGDEMTMTNCTVRDNIAESGGGIYNRWGELTMTNCTVSGNEATTQYGGGGICSHYYDITMTNCTVSGNTAPNSNEGGGIKILFGDLTMTNCTISDNTAEGGGSGGGIYHELNPYYVTMTCTIVYGNSPGDIDGGYTDGGENIVGNPDGDPDPLLGLLQDNGGPTETHALLAGSPAIDACVTGCTVDSDQRGVSRPQLTACDVGAYECQQHCTLPVVPVGGTVEPVDRIGILAPWLGIAAFMAVAMATIVLLVLLKRRRIA